MAEVSDITIKRTQDSLGKLIKKPQLTDKLLRKPPFKFLHDIIHAVISNIGLFVGLYTNDELQSENIKDRDAKIAFLQKAIDTLKIATKQDIRARPSKIVAGLEAEKTNEFLIAIARAIDRKIDTTEAVTLVKSGNVSDTQKKEPKTTAAAGGKKTPMKGGKEMNELKKAKSFNKKSTKRSDGSEKVVAGADKQSVKHLNDAKKSKPKSFAQIREQNDGDKKTESDKDSTPKTDEPEMKTELQPKVVNVNKNTNGNAMETQPNIKMEQMISAIAEIDELPKGNIMTTQDEQQDSNQQHVVEQKPDRTEKSAKSARSIDKIDRISEVKKVITENDVDESLQNKQMPKSNEVVEDKNKSQETARTDTVPSTSIQDRRATNDKPRSSKSRKNNNKRDNEQATVNSVPTTTKQEIKSSVSVDKLAILETTKSLETTNKLSSKTRPALRSAAVRPISARPSAPRRRDRNVRQILHTESFIQEPNSQQNNKSNKKNAIPDFDDADNIVITETIQDNISVLDESTANNEAAADIDGKQGHLVQQILETQTAILKADTAKNDPSAINDDSILSDRKSFTRNTTELRKMIQKLSLFITPLGKMMEYFQEDVDAMQIELLMWQKAGAAAQVDIKEEQRATEKLLENFKYHLAEINNSMKDHIEQINNTTTNIIQNEDKISKLIATL